jgi:hypothetical protein
MHGPLHSRCPTVRAGATDEHKVSSWFVPGPQDWDQIGIAVLIITLIVLNAMILVEPRRGPEA